MAAKRLTLDNFIEQSKRRFGNKFIFKDSIYLGNCKPIMIRCKKHGEFETQPNHFLRSKAGCQRCWNDKNGLTNEEFIYRCKKVHGDRYDYSKVKYKHNTKPVIIICRKHGVFKQEAREHGNGKGCNKCSLELTKSDVSEFIRKARALYGNRYDYSKVVYINQKTKVEIVCRQHGTFNVQPNLHLLTKVGCPSCTESKGESRIREFLTKHQIKFIQEYRIEPYRYRYDFYIPKLNLLIEFHGMQHYKPVSIFGAESGFKKTVKRDKAKREIARRNDYLMMTVSYRSSKSNNLERIIRARLSCLGHVFK